jgi:signal transduction histidine kinase/ActR/RegA family two-component response regulator
VTRRRPHTVTIRRQLAGLAVVVALPLLGAIAYTARTAHEDAGAAAKRTSSQLAALTASSVQEFIDDAHAELAVLAARPLVRRLDAARCDPFLQEARRLNQYAANVTTVDVKGQSVCSSLRAPPGGLPSVAGVEWFERVRRSGRFTVGDPFRGRISHRLIAVLALPIVDGGRLTGYVTMSIDLVDFQAMFARLAGPSQALVTVATTSGVIVARSLDAVRFVGTQESPEKAALLDDPPSVASGPDGIERIYAHAPIAGTSWVVSSGMPTSVAYGATDRLSRTLLVVGSLLFMLAVFAAVVAGRWIAGPVQALAQRAREIAEGRGHAAATLRGPQEVVVAARRLDEMVEALQQSEHQLGHALDASGQGAWAIDLVSGGTWRSLQHDRIFGYSEAVAEWTVETAFTHVVPDDQALFRHEFAEALVTGRLGFECRIVWEDGSQHWIRVDGRVERGEGGEPLRLIGTVADVTDRLRSDDERAQLEEELRQSQKMEAVGQLAGGIAHDFNNLLTVISGYSELALSRLDGSNPELRVDIEEVARAGERAAQLTRQLLAFSRRQTLQTSVFDLNEAVSDSETLLRRLLGEHIDILGSFTPHGCPVNADRGQIEQILMNLAVNARDAMPDGGTLTIETEAVRLEESEARRRFEAPAGDYALLRVSDTGFGMDAATRTHAFEPFFTTKEVGEGTGLGLATVFGSVSQNGGHIALLSEPGAGATFEILLPLVAAPVPATAAPSTPPRVLGTERILLVEDDATVRALAQEILVGKGYDVLAAADGEEAFGLAVEHPFDLLITDMLMPKLSGKELVARLRHARPGLPVVLMSGYAYDAAGNDDPTAGDAFIQKPFSMHDLVVTVRATLDSHPAPDGSPTSALTPA